MKVKIELKRINGDVIFTHECEDNNVKKTIDAFRASGRKFDLNDADLRNANLFFANLSHADLSGADLSDANLRYANLSNANLKYANLSDANLRNADLSDSDLRNANLWHADLSDANLRNANLRYADLSDANLSNIDVSVVTAFLLPQCPSEGSFVAWKKVGGMIVKLLVTEDAMRSSATTLKCRCSKAKVLAIENMDGSESELKKVTSSYDDKFIYQVGETIEVENFDDNRWNECSRGIHFFISRELAVKY